jgi:hypothetical protein
MVMVTRAWTADYQTLSQHSVPLRNGTTFDCMDG